MLCYKQIICYHKKVSPVIICVASITNFSNFSDSAIEQLYNTTHKYSNT